MSCSRSKIDRTTLMGVVALAFFAGCSDDDPVRPRPDGPVSFSSEIQPIFNARCAVPGCHVQPSPTGNCDLTAGQSYANIVNVPTQIYVPGVRVTPGDPDNSVLYQLVEMGTMPANGGALQPSQITLIRKWIEEGAESN